MISARCYAPTRWTTAIGVTTRILTLLVKARTLTRLEACPSLQIATALIISFLGIRAVELAVLHLTTAFVHRLACFATRHFLPRAKCASREYRNSETNS